MPGTRRSAAAVDAVVIPPQEARPRRSTKRAAAPTKAPRTKAPRTKAARTKAPLNKAQATARANAALLTTAAASIDEAAQADTHPRRKSADPGSEAEEAEAEAEVQLEPDEEEKTDVDADVDADALAEEEEEEEEEGAEEEAAAEEEGAEEEEEVAPESVGEMGRGKRRRWPNQLCVFEAALESDDAEASAGEGAEGAEGAENGWPESRCRGCANKSHRRHTCGRAKVARSQVTLPVAPTEGLAALAAAGAVEGNAEGGSGAEGGGGGGETAETARSCHPSLLSESSVEGVGYLPAVTVSGAGRGARRRRDEKNGVAELHDGALEQGAAREAAEAAAWSARRTTAAAAWAPPQAPARISTACKCFAHALRMLCACSAHALHPPRARHATAAQPPRARHTLPPGAGAQLARACELRRLHTRAALGAWWTPRPVDAAAAARRAAAAARLLERTARGARAFAGQRGLVPGACMARARHRAHRAVHRPTCRRRASRACRAA
jgi:hypothetical protein